MRDEARDIQQAREEMHRRIAAMIVESDSLRDRGLVADADILLAECENLEDRFAEDFALGFYSLPATDDQINHSFDAYR